MPWPEIGLRNFHAFFSWSLQSTSKVHTGEKMGLCQTLKRGVMRWVTRHQVLCFIYQAAFVSGVCGWVGARMVTSHSSHPWSGLWRLSMSLAALDHRRGCPLNSDAQILRKDSRGKAEQVVPKGEGVGRRCNCQLFKTTRDIFTLLIIHHYLIAFWDLGLDMEIGVCENAHMF